MKRLRISDNRRFLVFDDGTPFFWLGDTAWELFHRCTIEEADLYLENRRQKGFNLIQAVVLAEFDGLNTPNPYGERPLNGNDPLQPNERYFEHVDRVIRLAGDKGMFVGLLPTWGDKIELLAHGKGPIIFNPDNAHGYGEWIGRRYRDLENLIWINGGDRSGGGANTAIWNVLGSAIKSADPNHLMTFHPLGGGGGHSSSEWFHHADWLDFNLAQSGHECRDLPNHQIMARDYALQPAKPCLDGEPRYEDHAVNWKPAELGYFDDFDARQAAYWAVFAGACGHTYGCHPIWQFLAAGREPVGFARRPWREAMNLPGAFQMGHLRRLIEARPFLSRIPDDSVVVTEGMPTAEHGKGRSRLAATRDESGSYAMVYAPVGRKFKVRMDKITGPTVKAWWFSPRDGQAKAIGEFPNTGERDFLPPGAGERLDWVLVLDNGVVNFSAPGTSDTSNQ
jgi:hypothetical protein